MLRHDSFCFRMSVAVSVIAVRFGFAAPRHLVSSPRPHDHDDGDDACYLAARLALQATEAMVTSIVLNDDVVPRMSAQSIELLADQASDGDRNSAAH